MQRALYDVLLVQLYSQLQPPNADPLSIEVLAGTLEKHCPECQVHLMNINRALNPLAVQELLAMVTAQRSTVLGLSMPQGTYQLAMDILTELDAMNPDQRPLVVLGHSLATYTPEAFLQRFPWALAVKGWGEEALITLVQMAQRGERNFQKVPSLVYMRNGRLFFTPVRNQITPEPPKRMQGEFFPRLETSRGCHYGVCTFCTRPPDDNKRLWNRLPFDTILSSVRAIKDQGYSYFTFADEDFIGHDLPGALTIAQGIAAIGGLSFSISVRADNIFNPHGTAKENKQREEVLKALKKAGLSWVFIGVESLSDQQLRRYGKGIRAQDSLKAAKIIKKLQLDFEVGFILFDPFVSMQDIRNTATALKKSNLWKNVGHLFSLLRVQKATGYQTWLEREKLLKELDVNMLSYGWEFQDQIAAKVAKVCLAWAKAIDPVYRALRNIERTNRNHPNAKKYVTKFRKLDLAVFQHTLKQLANSSPEQALEIDESFYKKRRSFVRALSKLYTPPAQSDSEGLLITEIERFLAAKDY